MASVFSHAIVAVTLGKSYTSQKMPLRFWGWSLFCSIVPDADVIGFFFGIRYGDVLGHRGLSHSLFFAALLGILITLLFFRDIPKWSSRWWRLILFFFVVTASHGVLDALTNGGLGIAFFSPFDETRYFFYWTPVVASPIGIKSFFSEWGLAVIISEIIWILIPSLVFWMTIYVLRKIHIKIFSSG